MSNIQQKTAALPGSGGAEKSTLPDQNLSQRLHEALTADKDQLFNIMQDTSEEVLMAALRNPFLDEQHLQVLLKRRGLGEIPAAIFKNRRLIENRTVKIALVRHPETPSHIVLALIPLLYLFELVKICQMPGISADIQLALERNIIQRIPAEPLGNKLTLARRGTAGVAEALLREGIPNLVEACLDNPHLKEGALYQFLTSAKATAENLSVIARSSRWSGRPNIRLAILKNPRTPMSCFTTLLSGLPASSLRDLQASPRLTFAQKELVRQASRNK